MRFLLSFLILGWAAHGWGQEPQEVRRIAFGSCAHQNHPQPIWETITALKPDVFVFLGDNIYADTTDMAIMKSKYDKWAINPGLARLKQSTKILATWDDHDYGKDDAGVEYPKKEESQKLFLDFFGVPSDSPRRQQAGVYHAEILGPPGKRTQFIMLDTRYFRTPLRKKEGTLKKDEGPYLPDDSDHATFLGEKQWAWLEEQLKQPAELRIIGSSIQFVAEDHGWEKWANFPKERERFLKLLASAKAQGVVILSGDRHLAEISMMATDLGFPLYDVTSSGLSEGHRGWRLQETNRHRVGTMNFGNNFGFIAIDWNGSEPVVRLQIRDEQGDVVLQQKLALGILHPNHGLAPTGTSPMGTAAGTGTVTVEEAMKMVGKTVTLEFQVAGTGSAGNRVFLNSLASFRDPKNFTVVLEKGYLDKEKTIKDPRGFFKGKKVQVTGKVEKFRDATEIKVSDPKQIKVVESK